MSRRPLAPEVWEQALTNGRCVAPGDDAAALAYAEAWYQEQGGTFQQDDPGSDPFDPLMPAEEPAAPVEEAPLPEDAPTDESPVEEPQEAAAEPVAEGFGGKRRRVRTSSGQGISTAD